MSKLPQAIKDWLGLFPKIYSNEWDVYVDKRTPNYQPKADFYKKEYQPLMQFLFDAISTHELMYHRVSNAFLRELSEYLCDNRAKFISLAEQLNELEKSEESKK